MKIRPMSLPVGWYPREGGEISALCGRWDREAEGEKAPGSPGTARAAISPHAGWTFCGRFMRRALRSLDTGADCLVIFGGHLGAGATALIGMEDAFQSPQGPIASDRELRDRLLPAIGARADIWRDNTVEVLLPMAREAFPEAALLWLRVPNDETSLELGDIVARTASELGRRAVAVGSTDLTHYGEGYGFAPHGLGREAEDWVRGVNDSSIIEAFLGMDEREAIRLGNEASAACSAGAAAAAMSFARFHGALKSVLLGYGLSTEVMPSSDFVGYCAVSYS